MNKKIAILLDGGFVRPLLYKTLGQHTTADSIDMLCSRLLAHPKVQGHELYRIFYYDCRPYSDSVVNPISGDTIHYRDTEMTRQNLRLLNELELKENFAVRHGVLINKGWRLDGDKAQRLGQDPRLTAEDIRPNFQQKGVDMKLGLDISWLSLKRLVDSLLLVAGDSDIIPALKFARKEGTRVFLYHFDHPVYRDLRVHSDVVLDHRELNLG